MTTRVAASGSITAVAASLLVNGTTFTLNDGLNPAKTFEIDCGTHPTGTITCIPGNLINDGEKVQISGPGGTVDDFEFDKNGSVGGVSIAVPITDLMTADEVRDALIAAIMSEIGYLQVEASIGGSGIVSLYNQVADATGNVDIFDTVANAGFTHTGMSGGGTGDGLVGVGNTPITLAGTETAAQVRDLIVTAINSILNPLRITASASGVAGVALVNDVKGAHGNVAITNTSALTVSGMSGGVGALERVHTTELLDEILRLLDEQLRTTLSLKGVYRGMLPFMPAEAAADHVNGIWVNIEPSILLTPVQLPTDFLVTYMVRLLYVRRINVNENVLSQKEQDIRDVIDMVFDNFTLSSLALSNGQVMWWLPTEIEMEPQEDGYVASLAEDLVAVAFKTELQVRTRR